VLSSAVASPMKLRRTSVSAHTGNYFGCFTTRRYGFSVFQP